MCEFTPKISCTTTSPPRGVPDGVALYAESLNPSSAVRLIMSPIRYFPGLKISSSRSGTAWTTLHLPKEKEAAELLGIPYDRFTQAGLIPVAYTKGTDFKPAPRLALDTVVHWESW